MVWVAIAGAGIGWSLQPALSQEPASAPVRLTLVVFADRSMEPERWSGLFDAVREEATAEKMVADGGQLETLRGDEVSVGIRVDQALVVYLHGNCRMEPLPLGSAYGAPLGWVRRENGSIAPFIHVDCTRIAQMLRMQLLGLKMGERNVLESRAIARVIAHEWIHVARQSAEHGRRGITKSSFGVADLVGDPDTPIARR